ncbi:unnamed protein product [Rangifer tarandus platyrhynchus]|uniref:Uncharacterized protein n=1 Tax=Rangifer tarandus platyrhynchus TaxID=3082113 RepID=A0ABN8ZF26_RANTA|nr:unnamed protein product [Rangifer tarandus platyrhynchus]
MNSLGSCQRQEAPGCKAALSKVLEGGSFNPPSTSPPVLPGLSWLHCEMRPACHVRADCSASEHTPSEETASLALGQGSQDQDSTSFSPILSPLLSPVQSLQACAQQVTVKHTCVPVLGVQS